MLGVIGFYGNYCQVVGGGDVFEGVDCLWCVGVVGLAGEL